MRDLQRTYKAAKFNSQEEGPRLCELQHNQEAEHAEALCAAERLQHLQP